MTMLALTLLAPLLAGLVALALRRAPEAIALAGVGLGFLAAMAVLAGAIAGNAVQMVLPGLPQMPLRLVATPLTALSSRRCHWSSLSSEVDIAEGWRRGAGVEMGSCRAVTWPLLCRSSQAALLPTRIDSIANESMR